MHVQGAVNMCGMYIYINLFRSLWNFNQVYGSKCKAYSTIANLSLLYLFFNAYLF